MANITQQATMAMAIGMCCCFFIFKLMNQK
jgi:hypothetical protein